MGKALRMVTLSLLVVFATEAQSQALPEGQILRSIYFGGGSYEVDLVQLREVYRFLDSLYSDLHTYHITIHSHTDNIGGAAYNKWLSEQRSNAVIQKLLDKSVPRELINQEDFGQYNPVYSNDTPLGRMKNRRVDIIFWPVVM